MKRHDEATNSAGEHRSMIMITLASVKLIKVLLTKAKLDTQIGAIYTLLVAELKLGGEKGVGAKTPFGSTHQYPRPR